MANPTAITGSMLYDLVNCPHRVTMDLFGNPSERDAVSPFLRLLWERGAAREKEVISKLEESFVDLSDYHGQDKEQLTLAAMADGKSLIYAGRITSDDLVGEPDLLRKESNGYIAGDIKSGAAEEGATDEHDGKPKKHYAVQLALYTDVLERIGRSAGRRAFVWDIHGEEVFYEFMEPKGKKSPRCLWDDYQDFLSEARQIVSGSLKTLPAYGGVCKNCIWYSHCMNQLEEMNDLTLIAELGRAKRDVMITKIPTIQSLASSQLSEFIDGKKTKFSRIGPATLMKFQERAKLISSADGKPYLTAAIILPNTERGLFFDIEVDPWRDFVYLHGFVERTNRNNETERFVYFLAEDLSAAQEERAFSDALNYILKSQPCAIYYYSKYERTWYRNLAKRYPSVCSQDQIENVFDPSTAIDMLFDVVKKATEWPTRDMSIKTLAQYLGFSWKDAHPSGAASIEWFYRWSESRDPEIRRRILEYNEDDCRATRWLVDGVKAMRLAPVGTQ
jgi:predicted RecB family nuclease